MPSAPRPRGAVAAFWAASLSVGLAAFVVLAILARTASPGALADASAVLSVSFVLAVVPGAIQLRAAAAVAGSGTGVAREPGGLVAWTAALLLAAPAVAYVLTVPAASMALLALQFPLAAIAAAQRGTAIGREAFDRAGASMAVEALVRVGAGAALGAWLGATGLAAALLLGTAAAAALGRGWHPGGARLPAGGVLGAAVTLGTLMLLANVDTLAAPRLLGSAAADAYAIAALPAKGVFFALFAVSWLAVPAATRARTARELLTPAGLVLGLGVAATAAVVVLRPIVVAVLGEPHPSAELLATLAAAMGLAATLATALAMAVARGAARPWLAPLAGSAALAAVVLATDPAALGLARLTVGAQLVVLAATTALLLRTLPSRAANDRERAAAPPETA